MYFFGECIGSVEFLDNPLDGVPFLHDARAPNYLPRIPIATAAPEKEICCRRDHKRRVRRAKLLRDANVKQGYLPGFGHPRSEGDPRIFMSTALEFVWLSIGAIW